MERADVVEENILLCLRIEYVLRARQHLSNIDDEMCDRQLYSSNNITTLTTNSNNNKMYCVMRMKKKNK